MELSFIPRRRVSQAEMDGWSIVDGYDAPRGWAVLMSRPELVEIPAVEPGTKAFKVREAA